MQIALRPDAQELIDIGTSPRIIVLYVFIELPVCLPEREEVQRVQERCDVRESLAGEAEENSGRMMTVVSMLCRAE